MKKIIILGGLILIINSAARAQIAQNGIYRLEQALVASGGTSSGGAVGVYKVEGAIGEPIAGTTSTSTPFSVKGGFFAAQAFAPTAAGVTVSGRVITSAGKGIRNVSVTLTDATGATRTTLSGLFGTFSFTDVPAGETYLISVTGKRFTFAQPAQVYSITGDTGDIVFTSEPINLQADN